MSPPEVLSSLNAEELDLWHRVQELWELSANNDAERIRMALHPSYMGWDMSAPTTHDREQAVASASGQSASPIEYELEPLSVRLYEGSTGVVHYHYTATVQTKDSRRTQVSGRWTEVHVKQGQRWLMVAVSGRPDPIVGSSDAGAMFFQSTPGTIDWRMHFLSPPATVFRALATPEGRARFWAEQAPELDGTVTFYILNYEPFSGKILECVEPRVFALEYYGARVRFELESDGRGGTDLRLLATGVDEAIRWEMVAGWVSVLMAMKAAVDHGVDLRNHDESRAWGTGYADN